MPLNWSNYFTGFRLPKKYWCECWVFVFRDIFDEDKFHPQSKYATNCLSKLFWRLTHLFSLQDYDINGFYSSSRIGTAMDESNSWLEEFFAPDWQRWWDIGPASAFQMDLIAFLNLDSIEFATNLKLGKNLRQQFKDGISIVNCFILMEWELLLNKATYTFHFLIGFLFSFFEKKKNTMPKTPVWLPAVTSQRFGFYAHRRCQFNFQLESLNVNQYARKSPIIIQLLIWIGIKWLFSLFVVNIGGELILRSLITFGFLLREGLFFFFVLVRKAGFRSKVFCIISFSSSALWSNAGICFLGWQQWG